MSHNSEQFVRSIERATGESIDSLRRTPLSIQWAQVTAKRGGKALNCVSMFPVIGRGGSVLRDRVQTHEQAEARFQATFAKLQEALKNG